MEEKERYVWSQDFNQECPYEEFDYIVDSETDKVLDDSDIKDLLNQQDKKIKELEKKLSKYKSYKTTDERIRDLESLYSDYKRENLQLKDQLEKLKKE